MIKMAVHGGRILFVSAVLFLAASCATAPGGASWRRVRTGTALEGKWTGNVTVMIPANPHQGIPATSFAITLELAVEPGSTEAAMTLTVNFEQFLDDLAAQPEAQEQGLTKQVLWTMLGQGFTRFEFTVTEDYRIIAAETEPVEDVIGGESVQSIEMSGDGTRLRYTLREPISFGIGDEGFKQIILNKNGAE
ncbi:MAG: hypothetical protein LBC88_05000 [Spirochaetaceae bacterium]|nr:hypothetical protein [Spirochaetaceae bacterium]